MEKENKNVVDEKGKKDTEKVVELSATSSSKLDGVFSVEDAEGSNGNSVSDAVEDKTDYIREGNTTVYKGIVPMKKTDDGEWSNFTIKWQDVINGKPYVYVMNVVPTENRRVLYDLIRQIFGDEERINIDIVRSEVSYGSSKPEIVYKMRLSCVTASGAEAIVDLKPHKKTDTQYFANLISLLKAKEIIR